MRNYGPGVACAAAQLGGQHKPLVLSAARLIDQWARVTTAQPGCSLLTATSRRLGIDCSVVWLSFHEMIGCIIATVRGVTARSTWENVCESSRVIAEHAPSPAERRSCAWRRVSPCLPAYLSRAAELSGTTQLTAPQWMSGGWKIFLSYIYSVSCYQC